MVIILALAAAACGAGESKAPKAESPPPSRPVQVPVPVPAPTSARPSVDPVSVHADELGVVPVLMYHQLLAVPKGDYDQTPAKFRAELTMLYAHHFRPITTAQLISRSFDLPAGTSPMVLTFDDSTASQYTERPDGSVRADCAVGILLSVAKQFGDNHPVASFYVNAQPFAGKEGYLAKLVALGMELGDHTATHANLRQLNAAGVQRELAQGLTVITNAVPTAKVSTMALPFGVQPHDHALAHSGASAGVTYDFRSVLLVGAEPARSPYAAGFDPLALPRIRSGNPTGDQAFTSTYWLPKLFSGAVRPFVSDGDPTHISFPKALSAELDPSLKAIAQPY